MALFVLRKCLAIGETILIMYNNTVFITETVLIEKNILENQYRRVHVNYSLNISLILSFYYFWYIYIVSHLHLFHI